MLLFVRKENQISTASAYCVRSERSDCGGSAFHGASGSAGYAEDSAGSGARSDTAYPCGAPPFSLEYLHTIGEPAGPRQTMDRTLSASAYCIMAVRGVKYS